MVMQHDQTRVSRGGYFGLFVLSGLKDSPRGLVSPYHTNGLKNLTNQKMTVKFYLQEYMGGANGIIYPYGNFTDISTDTYLSTFQVGINTNLYDTQNDLIDAVNVAILAESVSKGYTGFTVNDINNISSGTIAVTAASYQTIVSQTGTSAPAISGGFTTVNTYSGTPTFTWARTGAGIYTLTASSAVFNTSGKTGVFIQPLTNLNASIRGVVTSSTVVTITTAVQSVAILGLLGLTTTNTDALLSGTMIYIQTYS